MTEETIILAPGADGAELLKSLAMLGRKTMGTHILNGVGLSRMALDKSGESILEDYLNREEDVALIYEILQDETITYFEGGRSYSDAKSMQFAIERMRKLCAHNEPETIEKALSDSVFQGKNDALLQIYKKRDDAKKKIGKVDGIDIIRYAMDRAEPFAARFMILEEFPLMTLERALIDKLSEGDVIEMSLIDLVEGATFEQGRIPPRSRGAAPAKVASYTEAYGSVNEVEGIIDLIYKGNDIQPDECTIACASTREYAQLFYDYSCRYDIPVTFGTGLPIANSHPGELFGLLVDWEGSGMHGVESLKRILNSPSFDRIAFAKNLGEQANSRGEAINCLGYLNDLARIAGQLQLSFDREENRRKVEAYIPVAEKQIRRDEDADEAAGSRAARRRLALNWLTKLADELDLGLYGFFERYAFERSTPAFEKDLDSIAKGVILRAIALHQDRIYEVSKDVLLQMVGRQRSEEGHIHVTTIRDAMTTMRRNLFVCGLSAGNFPGRPIENHLLLDIDLERFGPDGERLGSYATIEQRKSTLKDLLTFADSCGSNIRLSYSGFSVKDLKTANPSSVLFEYFDEPTERIGYFDSEVDRTRLIGRAYKEGTPLKLSETMESDFYYGARPIEKLLERHWPATDLEMYQKCPRRFCIEKVFGVRVDEEDDPMRLMEGFAEGNMAHHLMERLGIEKTDKVTKEEFLRWAEVEFDDYFKGRIPLNEQMVANEKNRFCSMMAAAYHKDADLSKDREVVSSETEYKYTHYSGIKLRGNPDRIEKKENGDYLVVDFKTKQIIDHEQDRFETCLQVIVYCWLYKQYLKEHGKAEEDINISAEYRYLRQNESVTCRFDERTEKRLTAFLYALKESMETMNFERNERFNGVYNCEYCPVSDICDGWPGDER